MDVHKETVVVSVLAPQGVEGVFLRKTYRTFRNDLIRMRVWLKLLKVTEIAMESTGVYWRPIWNVLEDQGFRLLLVNPAQVKALAGRKSDGRDSKRIAEYLQDGRLDGSFVPPTEIRQLRIEQRRQRPQDAAFRLTTKSKQNEIVARENCVDNLRDDCVVISNDSGKHRRVSVLPQSCYQIVAKFVFHPVCA